MQRDKSRGMGTTLPWPNSDEIVEKIKSIAPDYYRTAVSYGYSKEQIIEDWNTPIEIRYAIPHRT